MLKNDYSVIDCDTAAIFLEYVLMRLKIIDQKIWIQVTEDMWNG